jgi:hypothetical protein
LVRIFKGLEFEGDGGIHVPEGYSILTVRKSGNLDENPCKPLVFHMI